MALAASTEVRMYDLFWGPAKPYPAPPCPAWRGFRGRGRVYFSGKQHGGAGGAPPLQILVGGGGLGQRIGLVDVDANRA